MMKKKLSFLFTLPLILVAIVSSAQDIQTYQTKIILTADSLKSGNTKDVLKSFFQLAFNNLTGPNKEINFSSNPFAVMLKSNPNLAIDSNYSRYRALRKTNFDFGVKLDSDYHINGFSAGIKYALIDKRDSSTSALLFNNLKQNQFYKETDSLQILLVKHATTIADLNERKKFISNLHNFLNSNNAFDQLDANFQNAVKNIVSADTEYFNDIANIISNPNRSIISAQQEVYDSLKDLIKNDLLWTIGITDTTYKDQFFFSNILIKTELVKGLGENKPGSNWELNTNAALNILDDSLSSGRDLKRAVLSFEPGLNWVFRNKSNDQSFFEFNLSGSYYHNFGKLYTSEKRDSLTINGTLRIRVISDIWVPVEIKYDPRTGNFFGFLNVRANFSALANFFRQKLQ